MTASCPNPSTLAVLCAVSLLACGVGAQHSDNPYRLQPYMADFPAELEYPPMRGLEYVRTRRQALTQVACNLQGNVRREAWQLATEFFWRAPEDAVDPLVEAMDRAMADPALGDVVRNCVEAMGRMANDEFDSALRRALQHKNPAVVQAAYAALAKSGKSETVRELLGAFENMDGRSRSAWLRAVRERLPEHRVEILQGLIMAPYSTPIRDEVLKEVVELPAKEAAEVLRPRWDEAIAEFKAIIAGVLHAAGDGSGTAWLLDAMQGEDVPLAVGAIRHCMFGPDADAVVGPLREPLLQLSTHLRPEIRLELVQQLARLHGDDVADVFEVLTGPDEIWEVRALAMRELTRRDRGQMISVLLEELPTATGGRLRAIINQLAVSGDPRAVPVLLERFEKAPAGEGRPLLQALAQNGSREAAHALCELFEGPEVLVKDREEAPLTTRSYLPVLLLNLRGPEHVVLERYRKLPKERWDLRARLLPTLSGYAVDRREQQELSAACIAPVREVLFDRTELPQLRVLALNLMSRNWLTIDDAMRLKNMRRDEQPGLRALFADFLNDAF